MALPSSNNGDADDELAKEIDRIKTAEEVEERTAEAAATFGYRYDSPEDREEISMQRRAAWDWVKTVGMKILEGSNLTQISLPVRLFEPRSFLERLTDNWSYIDYLSKAAVCTDPVLRFKYVIAFAVSGLSKQTTAGKPFNPILGETYQARYPNGARVCVEQTSHHPPISNWEVLDNEGLYAFTGEGSWSAAARGNSVRGQQGGWNRVRFASDAAEVAWELPGILLRGILWGERVLLYTGVMRFVDEKNNLSCSLSFDPDMEKCSFFTKMFKQRRLPDLLRGDIIRRSPLNGGTQSAEVTKLGTIEGVWLTHLDCDGKRLWDIKTAVAVKPEPVDNPLPSDCRFRQDLIALKAKDYDAAQTWKEKLENIQRADRALRREGLKERQSRKPAEASTAVVGAVGSVLQCARPVVERSLLCAQATGG